MQRLTGILLATTLFFLSGPLLAQASPEQDHPNPEKAYALWASFVDDTKKQVSLPFQVDHVTLLENIYAEQNIIYYSYRVSLNSQDIELTEMGAEITTHYDGVICHAAKDVLPALYEIDAKIIFIYNFADGQAKRYTYAVSRCKPS